MGEAGFAAQPAIDGQISKNPEYALTDSQVAPIIDLSVAKARILRATHISTSDVTYKPPLSTTR